MSEDRKKMVLLIPIMALACASVVGLAMFVLYHIHIAEVRASLGATAQSDAGLITAIIAILALLIGMVLYVRIGNPMSEQLETQPRDLQKEV